MPGVGPAPVQSRTFLVSGNLQVLDLPWKSFKNESEWEQSKFPWDREKERGQGVGERSNSRHLSAHRPTGKWVAHAISQFLGIFVSRRVVSQLCGTKSVSASRLGGVLFLKWSIPAVAWHLFPWAPPSTCGDRFHYNDDMMSFRLFLVSFPPCWNHLVLASPCSCGFFWPPLGFPAINFSFWSWSLGFWWKDLAAYNQGNANIFKTIRYHFTLNRLR